jgi:hypothetical protein
VALWCPQGWSCCAPVLGPRRGLDCRGIALRETALLKRGQTREHRRATPVGRQPGLVLRLERADLGGPAIDTLRALCALVDHVLARWALVGQRTRAN